MLCYSHNVSVFDLCVQDHFLEPNANLEDLAAQEVKAAKAAIVDQWSYKAP